MTPVPVDVIDDSGEPHEPVRLERMRRQTAFLLDRLWLDPDCEVSLSLVDETRMEELHREWMDEPGPTDVLSFPMDELRPGEPDRPRPRGVLGDIVLCPSVAARQATAAGHSFQDELDLLLTHGILHLLGYDHAEPEEHERMFALQGELLSEWRAVAESAPSTEES